MTRIGRNVVAAVILAILAAGISGCKKNEGPMEKTGREIDRAAEKTGQKIDNAIEKSGEKLEQAGDKIKKSVK